MTERNVVETDPYRKFFWILITACVGVVFAGAGSFFLTKATVDQQTKILDELRSDVKKIMETRYTGDQAAQDRSAMLTSAAADRKTFMEALNSKSDSWTTLLKEQSEINREQSKQLTELLMFKARLEGREQLK